MVSKKAKEIVEDLATAFARGDKARIEQMECDFMELWTDANVITYNEYEDLKSIALHLVRLLE